MAAPAQPAAAPVKNENLESCSFVSLKGTVWKGTVLKKSTSLWVGYRKRDCAILETGEMVRSRRREPPQRRASRRSSPAARPRRRGPSATRSNARSARAQLPHPPQRPPSPPFPQVLYKENAPGGPKKIINLVGANSLPEQGPPNHAFCLLTNEDKVYAFAGTDEKGRRDIMAAIKQVSGK